VPSGPGILLAPIEANIMPGAKMPGGMPAFDRLLVPGSMKAP